MQKPDVLLILLLITGLIACDDNQTERYFTNSWSKDSRYWTVGNENGSVNFYRLDP